MPHDAIVAQTTPTGSIFPRGFLLPRLPFTLSGVAMWSNLT